jgi:hypothetical protein
MGDHDGLESVITIGWNAQAAPSILIARWCVASTH